jgi:HSP20 family protein
VFPWKSNSWPFEQGKEQNNKKTDQYLKSVLSSAMSQPLPDFIKNNDFFKQALQMSHTKTSEGETALMYDIFQTHDSCIIQVKVPDRATLAHLKVSHSPFSCFIESNGKKKFHQEISLPSSVRKKGAKATYQNGLLEISLPKSSQCSLSEIPIHDLEA